MTLKATHDGMLCGHSDSAQSQSCHRSRGAPLRFRVSDLDISLAEYADLGKECDELCDTPRFRKTNARKVDGVLGLSRDQRRSEDVQQSIQYLERYIEAFILCSNQ